MVKFCKDCKHSLITPGIFVKCKNRKVIDNQVSNNNLRSLASVNPEVDYADAREEREKSWLYFSPCGKRGALWEQKEIIDKKETSKNMCILFVR